jgi:hypothetical protein
MRWLERGCSYSSSSVTALHPNRPTRFAPLNPITVTSSVSLGLSLPRRRPLAGRIPGDRVLQHDSFAAHSYPRLIQVCGVLGHRNQPHTREPLPIEQILTLPPVPPRLLHDAAPRASGGHGTRRAPYPRPPRFASVNTAWIPSCPSPAHDSPSKMADRKGHAMSRSEVMPRPADPARPTEARDGPALWTLELCSLAVQLGSALLHGPLVGPVWSDSS